MSTMAVVTRAKTASAVIRWAARFAKMRNDRLTVFCSLIGTPEMPTTPVNLTQPELKQVANDAYADNLNIDVYVLQEAAIKRTKF